MIEPRELARLLDNQGPALRAIAAAWCDCADDCVQEAFIRLAAQTPVPDSPAAWLVAVVRNQARSQARQAGRRRTHESAAGLERLRQRDTHRRGMFDTHECMAALEQLPTSGRELVVMRIWNELTFDEIATVVGRSRSDVHRRYQESIRKLQAILEERCPSHDKTTADRAILP